MRRLVIIVAVAWGVVVLGLGIYAVRNKPATVRDQTTIADALPTVNDAVTDVARSLDPATAVPVLSGYAMVGRSCSVTLVREGARWERELTAYTKAGAEPQLLDRVSRGLPARYLASLKAHVLSADAGNYVSVKGSITAPGQVRFVVDTGCRPQDKKVSEASQGATGREPVQAVLDQLKITGDVDWQSHQISCPGGGSLWTVEAKTADGSAPTSLADTLPTRGTVLLSRPEIVAYRDGGTGVVVRQTDGRLTVTASTGC